jgi:hypothetical protein
MLLEAWYWRHSGKKKDRGETQKTINFAGFFKNLTMFMAKLKVLVLSFLDITDNSNMLAKTCHQKHQSRGHG